MSASSGVVRHLVAVRYGYAYELRVCGCPSWDTLNRRQQDVVLAGVMDGAHNFDYIQDQLTKHGSHIVAHGAVAVPHRDDCVRHGAVMAEVVAKLNVESVGAFVFLELMTSVWCRLGLSSCSGGSTGKGGQEHV